MASLNKNNSAIKRIMAEAKELAQDKSTDYTGAPLEDDIFEWHCTLRGPAGTEFEGGLYHFRMILPAQYPFKAPAIMMLTPNGRFELNTKICISFTSFHEELWQPAWGVRTALIGLQGFFPLKGQAAAGVGSVECPASERRRLAALSRDWVCPHCQVSNHELLPDAPEIPVSEQVESSTSTAIIQNTDETPITPSQPTAPPRSAPPEDELIPIHTVNPLRPTQGQAPMEHHNMHPSAPLRNVISTTRSGEYHSRRSGRHARRPPLALDGAICVLLTVAAALIYRRLA